MNNIEICCNTKSKEKYILLVCHHLSSLFQFVVLRMTRLKNSHVVLLVYNDLFCHSSFAKKLEEKKIFNRILEVKEPKNFDEKQHEKFVTDYYDSYFTENDLSFDYITEIYTACDLNNLFPIYCIKNNRGISYIEMYKGQFSDKSRYLYCTTFFGYPLWIEELYRKYNTLSGDESKYTIKRYLWPGSPYEYQDKDIYIDFLNEFFSLPQDIKSVIIDCIGLISKKIKDMSILLLNSPKWTKSVSGLDTPFYYLPYLLAADYYCDNTNVFLKNHPHAEADYYFINEISLRANIAPSSVPIEFYGLFDNFRIKRLVSVESSGTQKVSDFIDEEICLTKKFLTEYQHIHKCFITLSLAHELDQNFIYKCIGISEHFIKKLNHGAFGINIEPKNAYDSNENRIYQIVNTTVSYDELIEPIIFDKKRTVVFCQIKTLVNCIDKIKEHGIIDQMLGIEINKTSICKEPLFDTQKEYLFVLSSDVQYMCKIKDLTWEYTLHHTGLKINARVLNNDELTDLFADM